MFNAVVSRTITVKFPWKIPSTESMFRERSVTPVSLLMTEVMLVTIAMSSRPMTRSVTIYPLSPFTAPFGLDDAVTETAEHFLCVRAVHPVDLDALRGDETEHLVAIDRVAALRQLILDARQVLVNHQDILVGRDFFYFGCRDVFFGAADFGVVVRFRFPAELFQVFVDHLVRVEAFFGNLDVKVGDSLEPFFLM